MPAFGTRSITRRTLSETSSASGQQTKRKKSCSPTRDHFDMSWHFAGNDAAENHARLWSLIASADRHGIDPQRYLVNVLPKTGQTPREELEQFLPNGWKREDATDLAPQASSMA